MLRISLTKNPNKDIFVYPVEVVAYTAARRFCFKSFRLVYYPILYLANGDKIPAKYYTADTFDKCVINVSAAIEAEGASL